MLKLLVAALILILLIAATAGLVWYFGLPMRALPPPQGAFIGAFDDFASDPGREELFAPGTARVVPFQILYPASAEGRPAAYLPQAGPVIAAISARQGVRLRAALGRIGQLSAPWSMSAPPAPGGPFPVILYLPGATGYMQMGSFQTATLAAKGAIVVTLNQPGAVAAAVLPDGQVIDGMTRDQGVTLISPSYRLGSTSLPDDLARALAPQNSVLPYLAADVTLVLDRLADLNADPTQPLHGLLDLTRVGVMGMSLGGIVAAEACADEPRITACLMMDAPVPLTVAASGLRQPALWISRPADDQRLERAAAGGWDEVEIAAQADSIDLAVTNSDHAGVRFLHGLFHIDFTDLPAIQPLVGWLGQSGPIGVSQAHHQINDLTVAFFARTLGTRP